MKKNTIFIILIIIAVVAALIFLRPKSTTSIMQATEPTTSAQTLPQYE